MTLTEFLLARIAEDEAAARRAVEHGVVEPGYQLYCHLDTPFPEDGAAMELADRFRPARVLAECEAKRRIVRDFMNWRATAGDEPNASMEVAAHGIAKGLEIACRLLALPYADHPDFQPEWKP